MHHLTERLDGANPFLVSVRHKICGMRTLKKTECGIRIYNNKRRPLQTRKMMGVF